MERQPEWNLISLVPDFSSGSLHRHFSGKLKDLKKADIIIGSNVRREYVSNEVASKVGFYSKKTLALYGSGQYHHLAYGLCRLANDLSKNFAYIHIDHHSDSYKSKTGKISCSSFVQYIVGDGFAKESLLIGATHPSAAGFTDEHSLYKSGMKTLEELLDNSRYDNVYLSIDFDIMKKGEISTIPSRGAMDKKMILDVIGIIKSKKNIISADILGYTFSLFPSRRQKSMQLYEDVAKAIIGKEEWDLHLK